ncbi:hypothetical protein [Archangium sp.]|uniref:hypothetical protein n=1 Tax=Archangium sp. TaxID=1872627 RepID=UPI00389A3789
MFTPRPIDRCTAVLVTTGHRALREPAKVRWEAVEELLGLALRSKSPFESRVTLAARLLASMRAAPRASLNRSAH